MVDCTSMKYKDLKQSSLPLTNPWVQQAQLCNYTTLDGSSNTNCFLSYNNWTGSGTWTVPFLM